MRITPLTIAFGLVVGLLQSAPARAQDSARPDKVSFYFAAHQDDWQLFMNPQAFMDVADGKTKTVFVHLTAGDAGLGLGNGGRRHPYYLARENGAEAAVRFMADADLPLEKTAAHIPLNGHSIYRVTYRNTVTYFLRVPDGNPGGTGYRATGEQSLERLANGKIETLSAIDGTTAYRGWADLVTTLRALMDHERGNAPSVQLNVAELDPGINPGDHSDHRMTARAALDATADLACARRLHYVNYASSKLPENLDAQQRDMESSVLAITAAGILALDHNTVWQRYHRTYLGRSYFRVEESAGRCDDPAPATASAGQTVASRQISSASGSKKQR